ncbi:hypothetical protein [Herbidospora cretacea]|uniref:hypothetical protein n=1 Tax=Herbidospora cretacea TaxID=28444 RepID=UPI000774AE40|nr:hypothetical protein [Herbidospora cretacea]
MRKSLRLMVAAATGAALFATGAVVAAAPAFAGSVEASGTGFTDLFIPPSGSDKIPFKVKVNSPYSAGFDKPGKVHVRFLKTDEAESAAHAGTAADIPTIPASPAPTPVPSLDVAASIPVSSSDKPGKWKYQVAWTENGVTAAPTWPTAWNEITVATATRVNSASVDPDPVVLKKGADVDVFANFKLEKYGDEKLTGVRFEHVSSGDYYSLNSGLEADDSYHGSASFDDQAPTGSWQLKVNVTRGSKSYSFVKGFSVNGPGSKAKAKSKITIAVSPAKVKKGKTVKIYGKVYRGTSKWGAWSKKILKLYFKKKGTKTWKFVGYVGANSTGKYSKTVKPKYDGYWRLQATGTSATNSSLSAYKLVDVR